MEINSAPPLDLHRNYLQALDSQDGGYSHSDRQLQMEQKKNWRELIQDLKLFIWNPEKKEVLGRNGKSWGQILLFYFVFYIFLSGMFALCIYGLLITISPYVPTYRDRVFPPECSGMIYKEKKEFQAHAGERMLRNVTGVTIRPLETGFHYAFNSSEKNTWLPFTESLHTFLDAYNDDKQMATNVECTPGQYFLQEGEEHEERKACQFRRSLLKNCSGIEDPSFGFSHGKPCILLKINRIVGFKAGSGTPITVSCETYKGIESNLGAVTFYPENYFDLMYFPYYGKLTHEQKVEKNGGAGSVSSRTPNGPHYSHGVHHFTRLYRIKQYSMLHHFFCLFDRNHRQRLLTEPLTQVNYTSPLVAMHFTEVIPNHDVTIQCKINGKYIINDHKTDRFLGRVVFTLNIG